MKEVLCITLVLLIAYGFLVTAIVALCMAASGIDNEVNENESTDISEAVRED